MSCIFNCDCRWEAFNPFSEEFKEAEIVFHQLVLWKQAVAVIASIFGGIFFVVGAFPVFCWAVRVLKSGEDPAVDRVNGFFRRVVRNVEEDEVDVQMDARQQVLLQDMHAAGRMDHRAPPNLWMRGIGRDERRQTLQAFLNDPIVQANRVRRDLQMIILGDISAQERAMLEVVGRYINALYGLNVAIVDEPLPLNENNFRVRGGESQYSLEWQMGELKARLQDDLFILGFTSRDLYVRDTNFVFGAGSPNEACGVFSSNRLVEEERREVTLFRILKSAAHQVGLITGIKHCKQSCCMQGTASLNELDRLDITICAEDMAKICDLNGWSLEQGYRRQRSFFADFFREFHFDIDFSIQIRDLDRKIAALPH